MMDAVNLIADAIREFEDSFEPVTVDHIDCYATNTTKWEFGSPLIDSIKTRMENNVQYLFKK